MRKGIKKFIADLVDFMKKHLSGQNPDLPFYILIFISLVVFILGTNLFVELTEEVHGAVLQGYDERIQDYIVSYRTPFLNQFFLIVTDIGNFYSYFVVMALAAIFLFMKLRNWKFILQLLGVIIIAGLSNVILKEAIQRERPSLEHMVTIKSLSYPSGHAMSAMAFYGFLIYLVFKIKMHRLLRVFLVTLFTFLILAIGFSRIYLGVHYPSDVAGGFIAGLIWVAFCMILFNIIDLLRQRKRRADGGMEEEEENLETS